MKRTGYCHMGCFDRKYKQTHHSQKECRDRNRLEAYAVCAPLTAHFTRHGDLPPDPFKACLRSP